jgi:hypothetical protein
MRQKDRASPLLFCLACGLARQRVGIFAACGHTKTSNITDMGGVAGFKDVPQALRFSKASKSNHDGWQALFLI